MGCACYCKVMLQSGKYDLVHELFRKMKKSGEAPKALNYKGILFVLHAILRWMYHLSLRHIIILQLLLELSGVKEK